MPTTTNATDDTGGSVGGSTATTAGSGSKGFVSTDGVCVWGGGACLGPLFRGAWV